MNNDKFFTISLSQAELEMLVELIEKSAAPASQARTLANLRDKSMIAKQVSDDKAP